MTHFAKYILCIIALGYFFCGSAQTYNYTQIPEVQKFVPYPERPLTGNQKYETSVEIFTHNFVYGALLSCEIVQINAQKHEVAKSVCPRSPEITSDGKCVITWNFKSHPQAIAARLQINCAVNPLKFSVKNWQIKAPATTLFPGIYDPEDPAPANRAALLAELAKLKPATAKVEKRHGVPCLIVDNQIMPVNAYKGHTSYKMFGESGADLIISFNCGQRIYHGERWDKALYDEKTGKFDCSAIENNLLRIYNANPRARVILSLDITPLQKFLNDHPDNILRNAAGVKGKMGFCSFSCWDSSPLKGREKWAWSYTGKEVQEHIIRGLEAVTDFLKKTPAGNIVIGFKLTGGHDGQFVQWEYGSRNGHFDYSEANRQALCTYLREIYKTDKALQKAWGDPRVTLASAANPTMKEFNSLQYFNDRPGLGRKIADCRRFIAIGTARMLNRMSQVLKRNWGRPCVVQNWYSTAIWAQPSRLALDELIKDDAVNLIGMVSNYGIPRSLNGSGASANSCIQALNLRNLIYIQEMDHRTWRTQRTTGAAMNNVAFPANPTEFKYQILRDGGSVLATGGQGFYLYDMFGSWYHDRAAQAALKTLFNMNRHVMKYVGQFPQPRVAIFMDEATRLMTERVSNNVSDVWRTSGIVPAFHFLSDLDRSGLPEYDLYVIYSPVTITANQLNALKKLADKPGKMLFMLGDAGRTSRDFRDTREVLAQLGMKLHTIPSTTSDLVRPQAGSPDALLENVSGLLPSSWLYIINGKLRRDIAFEYAIVTDPEAQILARFERNDRPIMAAKRMPGGGRLVYLGRNATLTPQVLHNAAKSIGITPFSVPGNAVYVGHGVAVIHRLKNSPAPQIDFGRETTMINPDTGKVIGRSRYFRPKIAVGECAAVCYLP